MSYELDKRQSVDPRYDLTPAEITAYEAQLAQAVVEQGLDQQGVYAVWLDPTSPYADVIRTYEKGFWDDIDEIMAPHEDRSSFLALLDTRTPQPSVVHGFRLSRGLPTVEMDSVDSTGIILIDDIVNSGQGFTRDEFVQYYTERGVDIADCVSVETNFKVKKAEHYNGLPMSQIGYVAIFNQLEEALQASPLFVFASVNSQAVQSFALVGLEYEPIAGRSDLRIPVSEDEFDDDYTGVAIPSTPKNLEVFKSLTPLGARSVDVK